MRSLQWRILLFAVFSLAVSPVTYSDELDAKGAEVLLRMPGETFRGELSALTKGEAALARALRADVEHLAGKIGERNVYKYEKLRAAAAFLEESLTAARYKVERQRYKVMELDCVNLIAESPGAARADEIIVIGAHYDSVKGSPGANDNGSGAAAVLALARAFAAKKPSRTLRFVLFVNEEPPWFQTDSMGSVVYAKACREKKERIVAALSLETMGYYSDEKDTQKYPFPFDRIFPSTGNFIGFVGNVESGPLVSRVVTSFREHAKFPSEGAAVPPSIVAGAGFSDQWSFWKYNYPGLMVTDTAMFRYPHYHTRQDTPDKLDYERMARVVSGLEKVVAELATPVEK